MGNYLAVTTVHLFFWYLSSCYNWKVGYSTILIVQFIGVIVI